MNQAYLQIQLGAIALLTFRLSTNVNYSILVNNFISTTMARTASSTSRNIKDFVYLVGQLGPLLSQVLCFSGDRRMLRNLIPFVQDVIRLLGFSLRLVYFSAKKNKGRHYQLNLVAPCQYMGSPYLFVHPRCRALFLMNKQSHDTFQNIVKVNRPRGIQPT